ncbi:MAG: hypothetical protein QM791_20880 [Ferruginibacter sp.]
MNNKNHITFHFLFSIACTPVYLYAGIAIKLLLLPYIVWMVFKKNAAFLPVFCIQVITETMIMNVIYASIIIVCIREYHVLKRYAIHRLFNLLLLILPAYLFFCFLLVYRHHVKFNDAVLRLNFFIPLFSFFYGVLIAKSFDRTVIRNIVLAMAVVYLFHLTNFLHVRFLFYAIPLFGSAMALAFTRNKKYRPILIASGIFWIYYLFTIKETTFTLLFIIFFSLLFSAVYFSKLKIAFFKHLTAFSLLASATAMIYGMVTFSQTDYSVSAQNDYEKSFDLKGFKYKFFEDRVPFWVAGFKQIMEQRHVLFPIVVEDVVVDEISETKDIEVTFGAHNFYLEAVRTNGFIGGILLISFFVVFLNKGVKIFRVKNLHPPFVIIVSTTISASIVGCFTGTFPMMPPFGLMSICMLGVCFAVWANNTNTGRRRQAKKFMNKTGEAAGLPV